MRTLTINPYNFKHMLMDHVHAPSRDYLNHYLNHDVF